MIKRSEIFAYAEKQYNAKPDCPFENYRRYAVLRHSDDDKWFGLVMNVSTGTERRRRGRCPRHQMPSGEGR
jgi:predicted DNA-binding protein (MmcQ/YjbR family)